MKSFLAVLAGTLAIVGANAASAADIQLWRLDCGSILVKDLSAFSDTFDYAGKTRTLTDTRARRDAWLGEPGADGPEGTLFNAVASAAA